MKTPTFTVLFACLLCSCKNLDTFLVSKTGLTSANIITIGFNAKMRVDETIEEVKSAKQENTSGKESIEVLK